MKSGLAQNTATSAKTLAQQIAKQVAQEPIEVLKDVKEQTLGSETSPPPDKQTPARPQEQQNKIQEQQKVQDKMKSTRMYEAYQRELDDIRKQDVFKDLQARISQGEEVPLEDYPELSMEQKQVLKAQMEAVKLQESRMRNQESGIVIPTSKPSRRFGAGQKQEMEKQQTRVEKPVPLSG